MLEQLLADIQQEFEIDEDGKGYATIRGAARLANVQHSNLIDARPSHKGLLTKLYEWSAEANYSLPICLKPFAGFDYRVVGRLPDLLVAGIVTYYAYESKASNEHAKKVVAAFSAIGFRSWLQQELGWQKPSKDNQPNQVLPLRHPEEAAKSVAASIQSIHQSVALIDPRLAQILIDHAMRGLDSQSLLTAQLKGDRLAGCVEIANDLGFYSTKDESSLGKAVAKAWRLDQHAEPQSVNRECGGAFREINAYPFNSVVVREAISSFYAAKNIAPRTANLKVL